MAKLNAHQNNKSFKSKHASKGELKKRSKGKVERENKSVKSKKHSKIDRKNASKIEQKKKRDEDKEKLRVFCGTDVCRNVAVVPLSSDLSAEQVVRMFTIEESRYPTLQLGKELQNQKLKFIPLPRCGEAERYFWNLLDASKVADSVLFILSAQEEVDEFAMQLISALRSQGLPDIHFIVQNLDKVPVKKQADIKKSLSFWVKQEFNEVYRVYTESEQQLLLRAMTSTVPKLKRDMHAYMLADQVLADGNNRLIVRGVGRGRAFNVNRMVHLPEFGDFQLSQIEYGNVVLSANPEEAQVHDNSGADMEESDADYDEMETIDDKPQKKRVVKGTSSYQAAWILDDAGSDVSVSDEDMDIEEEEDEEDEGESGVEYEDVEEESRHEEEEFSPEEEEHMRQQYLEEQRKRLDEEKDFPDEVETPLDIPARKAFKKYRAVQSFRTSVWDQSDGLPKEYSQIYQFENFKRTAKSVFIQLEEEEEGVCAPVNTIVTLYIENVPENVAKFYQSSPCVVFGLLPHEEKMSVLNMTCSRVASSESEDVIIKNKDPVIIQSGFRRVIHRPVYSQHKLSGNEKMFKLEKYMLPGMALMATVYAPIQYAPCPVLYFVTGEVPKLVATGSLFSVDPNRLIIKRKVLTGIPTKINPGRHRHTAVVRYMFHNPEDVAYFSPVELKTSSGRRGHIKCSVGTHGAMKCLFDKQLKSDDIICLPLYKRVFPKYPENGYEGLYNRNLF